MMMADNYEKEIRKRIEHRYKKRSEFGGMLISLVVMNAGIWFVLQPGGGMFMMAAQCFLGISVIALGIAGTELLMNELKEAAIQREIDAERVARMGEYRYGAADYEKAKNPPMRLVQISDDGELLELEDDADDDELVRRRRL
jgi:hypothetical protein